ncbi:MAG: hypothetical protein M3044_17195 [Thermoproteota archaeon]|nr:hypothetical protein [Thermoproteota archaeon]
MQKFYVLRIAAFATSNNIKKISVSIHSMFFIVELESDSYKRFCEITKQLLSHHNVRRAVASTIDNTVLNKSQDSAKLSQIR